MHVSSNIIHFPAPAAPLNRYEETKREPDNVVAFPSDTETPVFSPESREHGQVYAAHRIVGRIAAQLDSFAAL